MILDAIARRFQVPPLADLTKLAVEARLDRIEKAVALAEVVTTVA